PRVVTPSARFVADTPRIGLYKSYDAAIDEGWTRWVFDNWKVPYTSIVDSTVRAGKLKDRFDVIILPDQSPKDILDGLPSRYPVGLRHANRWPGKPLSSRCRKEQDA